MNLLSRLYRIVRYPDDLGHSAGALDQEQLSFLEDMLGEVVDPPEDESDEQAFETAQDEIETSSGEVAQPDDGTPTGLEDPIAEETPQQSDTETTIQSLRDQILSLTQALQNDPLRQSVSEEVTPQDQAKTDNKQTEILTDFLTVDELDRLIDEPGLINTAFQRYQQQSQQNISLTIQQEISKQLMINRAVTDFYSTNQDLLPYANFVKFVMGEIETRDRGKSYKDIFTDTASECRKRLGLSTTTVVSRESNKAVKKPAFAGSKQSNSRPQSSKEFFDKNAADIFDLRD